MPPKSALKSIKAHIDKSEFAQAVQEAKDLVKEDPQNHTAFLFLGFAYEKQNDLNAAESALEAAASLRPQDVQAYKGLVTLYEKQDHAKLDKYHHVTLVLAQIYADQDDREQCQNVVDKYETFAKRHGSPPQYRHALELILPSSPLYPTLEGRVLKPSLAYQRTLESAEAEEEGWIKSQVSERRTRIGARVDQVTLEVKREAIPKFLIEDKLTALIDWTQDDDRRHELEQKRFQRMYDNLLALPAQEKPTQRDKVVQAANGIVIIKQQYCPGWKVALEWVDAEDLFDWDPSLFHEYIGYFPDDGLSKVLNGFLASDASPFPQPEPEKDSEAAPTVKLSEAEQVIMMNEGLIDCSDSAFAHRIVAHTYLHLGEWQDAVTLAEKSQQLYLDAQNKYALDMQNSLDGVRLTLANALIHYQSPRHHQKSMAVFKEILLRKPKLTAALLGVGLIYEEDEQYAEATSFLEPALERDPQNLRIQSELAWCKAKTGKYSDSLSMLQDVLTAAQNDAPDDKKMLAELHYRIGVCKWHIDSSNAARKDRDGPYSDFVAAIQANNSYAPAWTHLGVYFQDYTKKTSKNKENAEHALRMAFELSASELTAAERLASQYANTSQWDLVELVASRVIASDSAKVWPGSKKKAPSWPHAALGIANINKQQYSQSIISFQAALRINPSDYHSWVGLGESYLHSGRYVSAARAFSKAESIDHGLPPDQTWFAKYMLANVQKEVGDFDAAILSYEGVLETKVDELGMLLALLQSFADNAWAKISQGLYEQGRDLALRAIDVGMNISDQKTGIFNLWKSVADACSALAHVHAFVYAEKVMDKLESLLQCKTSNGELELFDEHDGLSIDFVESRASTARGVVSDQLLVAAILAHKRGIHVASHDVHAQAVSWYNLGWAEYRAASCAGPLLQTKGQKPKRLLRASMRCFKHAIELEASNPDFWNALGVVTMTLSPKVSQHSLVRSLNLNDNSPRSWTNLGVLYLLNNDTELANQAFTRAQSADPEYAEAWLGQGLIAVLTGHSHDARNLFTHAFEISDGSLHASRGLYSTSIFDFISTHASKASDLVGLLQPLLAVRQLHNLDPINITVTHLMALYAERVGDFSSAESALREVCDVMEAAYEESESDEHLSRFVQAKADLARVQLGTQQFESAIENASVVLDLTEEADDPSGHAAEARDRARLSAHVTTGLAQSHSGVVDASIASLQAALQVCPDNPDIICMLAQVLWAKGAGSAAEKEAARTQLLNAVSAHPGHVQSVCLLAVAGLTENDTELLAAVVDDLDALQKDNAVSDADQARVSELLAAIQLQNIESTTAYDATRKQLMTAQATADIMLAPWKPAGWLELYRATATNDEDDESRSFAGEMAVGNALRGMPPGGDMRAEDIGPVGPVGNASAIRDPLYTSRQIDAILRTIRGIADLQGW
ncbi:Superkiller protein 3 [Cyphellophora attinorum]|uniref:Superkiller protein 3 n=1 Tax=Cyphellophora attinorum TaxID=1664694 RepID=A0A0N1HGL9_9EURO|nr:Superkiller protein 3 [Phialophora attinorum]KPI44790.1 Superkiller protein 3 [Phialophora attinorum]